MNNETPSFNSYQEEINDYHEDFDEAPAEYTARANKVFEAVNTEGSNEDSDGYSEDLKKIKDISYKFLEDKGYPTEQIDELFYDKGYTVIGKNNEGEPIFKTDENGKAIWGTNKEYPDLGMEYLLKFGITVPDLYKSGIIGEQEPISAIKKFSDELYVLTDTGYFPDLNKRFDDFSMSIVKKIVDKRTKGEALDGECREFAHACFRDSKSPNSEDCYEYINNDVGNRLLFGGPVDSEGAKYVLEEAEALIHDSTDDYLDRVCHLENVMSIYRGYVAHKIGGAPEEYIKAENILHRSIERKLPNIYDRANRLAAHIDQSDEEDDIAQEKLQNYGLLMLRNFGVSNIWSPVTWTGGNALNETGVGLGEAMIKCGIEPDTILDTYFGGPNKLQEALPHEPTFPYLEARWISDLMKIGISKENIIDNIRKKNESRQDDPFNSAKVSIHEEEVEKMREAGCSNAEILDAMGIKHYKNERVRETYKKDFNCTDEDFIELLLRKIDRIENE